MVNKCSALNCRSGYSGETKDPNITFHSFPFHDENLMKIWLKNIARKDFKPTKYTRICSLHFKLDDFREDSSDHKESRKRLRKDAKLLNRRLRKDAVPCIFEDLPAYYECNVAPSRSEKALSSSRLENDANLLEEQAEKFLEMDKLQNFDDLLNGLKKEQLPQGFISHHTDSGIDLICLSEEHPPSISGTLCIDKQLNFCLYSEQHLLPSSSYKHILADDAVSLLSQVINLMAFLKNLKTSNSSTSILLAKITQLIEEFSDLVENAHELRHRLCNFILEQLNLITQNKRQRRYSADLLLISYIINATSSKAYERLREEQNVKKNFTFCQNVKKN